MSRVSVTVCNVGERGPHVVRHTQQVYSWHILAGDGLYKNLLMWFSSCEVEVNRRT